MKKEEFVKILEDNKKSCKIFSGRFIKKDNTENIDKSELWYYHRPSVDFPEPVIDLSEDGIVKYITPEIFGESKISYITYEDIILKFNLIQNG
jgi:hypothetical protein